MALLTCCQRIMAEDALRIRLSQATRVELHHARQIVGETLGMPASEIEGMLVSPVLRRVGWYKLDPAATGRDIAYGPRPA